MRAYLVQHGEANPKDIDPERSLSEKGIQDTTRMGEFLSQHIDLSPRIIYHSGEKRSEQTAEILAGYLHPADGLESAEGLKPMDDPGIWSKKIKGESSDIMLVGHLPHLQRLVSLICADDADNYVLKVRNSGVICIAEGESGVWTINWAITPDIIK